MIPLQASIVGFNTPQTVYCALSPEGVLVVAREAAFTPERREGAVVISNTPDIDRDVAFKSDQLQAAIDAYFGLKNTPSKNSKTRFVVDDRAARSNPAMAIERDGFDPSGRAQYRISDAVTSAQIAVLACCLYAASRHTITRAIDLIEAVANYDSKDIITL